MNSRIKVSKTRLFAVRICTDVCFTWRFFFEKNENCDEKKRVIEKMLAEAS